MLPRSERMRYCLRYWVEHMYRNALTRAKFYSLRSDPQALLDTYPAKDQEGVRQQTLACFKRLVELVYADRAKEVTEDLRTVLENSDTCVSSPGGQQSVFFAVPNEAGGSRFVPNAALFVAGSVDAFARNLVSPDFAVATVSNISAAVGPVAWEFINDALKEDPALDPLDVIDAAGEALAFVCVCGRHARNFVYTLRTLWRNLEQRDCEAGLRGCWTVPPSKGRDVLPPWGSEARPSAQRWAPVMTLHEVIKFRPFGAPDDASSYRNYAFGSPLDTVFGMREEPGSDGFFDPHARGHSDRFHMEACRRVLPVASVACLERLVRRYALRDGVRFVATSPPALRILTEQQLNDARERLARRADRSSLLDAAAEEGGGLHETAAGHGRLVEGDALGLVAQQIATRLDEDTAGHPFSLSRATRNSCNPRVSTLEDARAERLVAGWPHHSETPRHEGDLACLGGPDWIVALLLWWALMSVRTDASYSEHHLRNATWGPDAAPARTRYVPGVLTPLCKEAMCDVCTLLLNCPSFGSVRENVMAYLSFAQSPSYANVTHLEKLLILLRVWLFNSYGGDVTAVLARIAATAEAWQ